MATPVQLNYFGNQYDQKWRNSDIPDSPQPDMTREQYIAQQVAQNPNFGQNDIDNAARIKSRQGIIDSVMGGAGDAVSDLVRPFGQSARASIGKIGEYIAGNDAQNDYYNETGQRVDADTARKYYEDQNAQAAASANAVPGDFRNSTGVLALPEQSQQDQASMEAQKARDNQQSITQAATNFQNKGGQIPGDVGKDPVGTFSAMNSNKIRGVGDSAGGFQPPTPVSAPTPNQASAMQLDQMGQQANFDQNKVPVWYKSDSFNYGLISFGLNLLSGNDLATSFNAAGQAFGDMYGQEKRQIWAQDLAAKGYSAPEIEEWIRTGDSKTLTDPMKRQADRVALMSNMQNLNNLQYENSDEMRAYRLNREQRKDYWDEAQVRNQIANSNAQLSLSRARLGLEQQRLARGDEKLNLKQADAKQQESIQTNAVATQRAETVQAGRDLLQDHDIIGQGGSNYTDSVGRWVSNKFGSGKGVQLESYINHYNNKLTNLGNANLYLEAGGNRIFAKEMENAGKNFIPLTVDMTPKQMRSAIKNNEEVTSRFDSKARELDLTGRHQNAAQTEYGRPQWAAQAPRGVSQQRGANLQPGMVFGGRMYLGGNPNDERNWR